MRRLWIAVVLASVAISAAACSVRTTGTPDSAPPPPTIIQDDVVVIPPGGTATVEVTLDTLPEDGESADECLGDGRPFGGSMTASQEGVLAATLQMYYSPDVCRAVYLQVDANSPLTGFDVELVRSVTCDDLLGISVRVDMTDWKPGTLVVSPRLSYAGPEMFIFQVKDTSGNVVAVSDCLTVP